MIKITDNAPYYTMNFYETCNIYFVLEKNGCIAESDDSDIRLAFDIKTDLYSQMKKKNPETPNQSLNETLLNWVQNFEYVRTSGSKKSDFTNVIDVLCGKGNDCDSRSMLMCCIMQNLGVKSELFISRIYSHAVYGLDLNIPGAKIEVNGINFLLNETTARNIKPGLIAQDQCDTEKWIPVNLP